MDKDKNINRRDFIKKSTVLGSSLFVNPDILKGKKKRKKERLNIDEKSKINLDKFINQEPLKSKITVNVFKDWLRANDYLTRSEILDREEWMKKSVLKKEGKETIIYLPSDLNLWEMIPIIEKIDQDTYGKKSKRKEKAKKELLELGKNFKNAGVYINNRLDKIEKGKSFAKSLAKDFYHYGESLLQGEKAKKRLKIFKKKLSVEETEKVDRWLAGEEFYNSRIKKIKNSSQSKEELRIFTLNQFFGLVEKSFKENDRGYKKEDKILRGFDDKGKPIYEDLNPWESKTSTRDGFKNKIKKNLIKEIEKPKRDMLVEAPFRRGMEFLMKNLKFDRLKKEFKKLKEKNNKGRYYLYLKGLMSSIDKWKSLDYKTVYQALEVNKLKKELKEVKKSGDLNKIADKEIDIFKKVQRIIFRFVYNENSFYPSRIIKNQSINCVGASMLGGSFLSELGIKYGVVNLPDHSILMPVLSNNKAIWLDMLNPRENSVVTDKMVKGKKVSDLVEFINSPKPEGINFKFDLDNDYSQIKGEKMFFTKLFSSENGHQVQVFNSLGNEFLLNKEYEKAIEFYKKGIYYNPKDSDLYNGIGIAIFRQGKNDSLAAKYLSQAVKIDPEFNYPYYTLGKIFEKRGDKEKAIKAYQFFIKKTKAKKDMLRAAIVRDRILKLRKIKKRGSR